MTPLSDDEVLKGHDDLEMMRRPHLWPNSRPNIALLPLKRRQEDKSLVSPYVFGTLVWSRESTKLFSFRERSLPDFLRDMRSTAVKHEDAVTAITGGDVLLQLLINAGWIVD